MSTETIWLSFFFAVHKIRYFEKYLIQSKSVLLGCSSTDSVLKKKESLTGLEKHKGK